MANPPEGQGRKIRLYNLDVPRACGLAPYSEIDNQAVHVIVENPVGNPELRFFYLEADATHVEEIFDSLTLLSQADDWDFRVPTGPMHPEDWVFWEGTSALPDGWSVEEYTIVDATSASPGSDGFSKHIPKEVKKKWSKRRSELQDRITIYKVTLASFGYSLNTVEAKARYSPNRYELYHGDELILDEIDSIQSLSVSDSGQDFALVVHVANQGDWLLRTDGLSEWRARESLYGAPIFYGEDLLVDHWDPQAGQIQIKNGERTIFTFSAVFFVAPPIKTFRNWDGHWMLEVDGFLFQDGENLNEKLGYEEIFGFRTINDKPFYYFRKGPQVGISYDGQILPLYYEDVFHYACCGPAAYNDGGNESQAWFYGLREGWWYYVEVGEREP
jgi:hypothetical protein